MIFPVPVDMQVNEGQFIIDNNTFIFLPDKASKADDFLSRFLFNEIIDKFGQAITITRKSGFTSQDKFILVGDILNPLVKIYCDQKKLTAELKNLGQEGYILEVTDKNVVVAANTKEGALMGLSSLRQIISRENNKLFIPKLLVKDKPKFGFRGIRMYAPGRENITFFKRFIKDFVILYKFNTIIIEMNANMRLDRHPELNIGAVEFKKHLDNSRLDRPPGLHMEYQNSSHQDNADGDILEKEEVADIVSYMRKFNIEVIPELPSLTHAYYLLHGHEELAENLQQPIPDTYCPLKPESYKIYFEVLDEYIEVMKPSMIHVGHDEWRMEKDLCELCRGKDYGQLFADDLNKIHAYLAKKGIKTAIWGDHLLESVRQKEFQVWKSSAGYQYKIPGALKPEQVQKLIPKDILIFNWFWDKIENDRQVSDFGFRQVYGNMRPDMPDWSERNKTKGILGGAPSSWAASTELNFGKDLLFDYLGCANLLWSPHYIPVEQIALITQSLSAGIYRNFTGKPLPADNGSKIKSIDISSSFNSPLTEEITGLSSARFIPGEIKAGNVTFNIREPDSQGKRGAMVAIRKDATGIAPFRSIPVNEDVNSLIFLHATARDAGNIKAYTYIYNFDDTAELLGWYEIVYEDGYVLTVPIRYGVNILDWRWRTRVSTNGKERVRGSQNMYSYRTIPVDCSTDSSSPVTFFSYEWQNPRYGKVIKEINLKPANYGRNNENAIILLALSKAENTKKARAEGKEDE